MPRTKTKTTDLGRTLAQLMRQNAKLGRELERLSARLPVRKPKPEAERGTLGWYEDLSRPRLGHESYRAVLTAVRAHEDWLYESEQREAAEDRGDPELPVVKPLSAEDRQWFEYAQEQLGASFVDEWGRAVRRAGGRRP